jgi:hypothetical protein
MTFRWGAAHFAPSTAGIRLRGGSWSRRDSRFSALGYPHAEVDEEATTEHRIEEEDMSGPIGGGAARPTAAGYRVGV